MFLVSDQITIDEMSLFGEESSPTHQTEQKSLFDDRPATAAKSHSSLFDDDGDDKDSPWSVPTPKKMGRNDMLKTLLPASAVPESYIDAYDVLLKSEYRTTSNTINIKGAKKLLESGGIDDSEQDRMLNAVTGSYTATTQLGRDEANVLLALIGLFQEKEEPSLDGVDERRGSEYYTVSLSHSETKHDFCPRPSSA